jgi:penicillin-binding protein 2
VVVNSLGREIRTLQEVPATEGKRLQLTIDYDIQKAVDDAFKAAHDARLTNAGAAVVLDPNTGEVLAYSSEPAFDPNEFAAGIDRATWASLTNDQLRPLNDRALQGTLFAGSTFKMAVALAALEEGVITPDFKVHCGGAANFYGNIFQCWRKGGHGTIDLRTRSSSRATCTSTPSATWSAWTRSTSGRRCSASACAAASTCRTRSRASCPPPSGSGDGAREVVSRRDDLGGDRQGAVSVTPVSMAVYMATLATAARA